MKQQSTRILLASVLILGTIVWLAWSGYGSSKSYYVTIAELQSAHSRNAHQRHLRVEGFVVPGSIESSGTHVDFVINEFESHQPGAATGKTLRVSYKGAEPPPDAFKDNAQTLAEGSMGSDGRFHANAIQAKCSSKYESAAKQTASPLAGLPAATSGAATAAGAAR